VFDHYEQKLEVKKVKNYRIVDVELVDDMVVAEKKKQKK
jgi:hypothetical protein